MKRHERAGVVAALLSCAGTLLIATTTSAVAATAQPALLGNTTWVSRGAGTVETLHLHVDTHGAVSGNGSAIVTARGKVYRTSIAVHSGQLRNGALTLTLYVTQVNFGAGLTIAEYARCAITPRVLHCRTDVPLYQVRNTPQDFYRR